MTIGESVQVLAPTAPGRPFYSDAVRFGDLLLISGIIAVNDDDEIVGEDAAGQTRQIFENIGRILGKYDATYRNILRTTIFVLDRDDYPTIREARNEIYGPGVLPAATMVEISGMVIPGALLEVEAIAGIPG